MGASGANGCRSLRASSHATCVVSPAPDATSFIVFATAAMASQFSRAAAQRWPHSYVASAGVCGAVCACGCRCVVLGEALRGWLRETLSVHSNCDDPKMPEDLHSKNERGYAPQASSTQRAQSPHASAGTSCEDLDRDFHHVTTISLQMAVTIGRPVHVKVSTR